MSYSQNDEEDFIAEFFHGKSGRFLDVGAYDGVQLSNTRRLLESGWSGVLVEPAAHNFQSLMKNCRIFEDRTVLIQAAVSTRWDLARLWIDLKPDRQWSTTINDALKDFGSVNLPSGQNVQVPTIPMSAMERFGPYDFISMDAEWEDLAILSDSLNTPIMQSVSLLCVEPRNLIERDVMKKMLATNGWTVVHETLENIMVSK